MLQFSVVQCYSLVWYSVTHWCIKSINTEFAIAIDFTFKVVPLGFCSVQVRPFFRISFWLHRRSDKNLACSKLRLFGIPANLSFIYIPHSHQALKLQCTVQCSTVLQFSAARAHQPYGIGNLFSAVVIQKE